MANYVYIAQSLDGYIATKDGGVDWLNDIPNPDQSDFGFAEFLAQIEALVMGRNTFEKVQSFGFWPYSKPVFVISSTLSVLPRDYANKAQVLNAPPRQIVNQLWAEGYQNLYIDGGQLIQSFLAEDLIDELVLTTLPVLLGEGIPLFGKLSTPLRFELIGSEILANCLVKTHYRRKIQEI